MSDKTLHALLALQGVILKGQVETMSSAFMAGLYYYRLRNLYEEHDYNRWISCTKSIPKTLLQVNTGKGI